MAVPLTCWALEAAKVLLSRRQRWVKNMQFTAFRITVPLNLLA